MLVLAGVALSRPPEKESARPSPLLPAWLTCLRRLLGRMTKSRMMRKMMMRMRRMQPITIPTMAPVPRPRLSSFPVDPAAVGAPLPVVVAALPVPVVGLPLPVVVPAESIPLTASPSHPLSYLWVCSILYSIPMWALLSL